MTTWFNHTGSGSLLRYQLTIGREEIESLEVRTASTGRTLLLIGGVGALAAFLVVRDVVDALDEVR